uniref:hypothetical protein n=1 Tax=Dubosiella newyorkensis TaxID=1862672 RepID=UPI00258A2ECB
LLYFNFHQVATRCFNSRLRFFEVVGFLGGEVLPESLPLHSLPLTEDRELDALELRNFLSLNRVGPVGNLIEILENSGILVY